MDRVRVYDRYRDEGKISVESTKKIQITPFSTGASGGTSSGNNNTYVGNNTGIGYNALTNRYKIPKKDFYNPDELSPGDNISVNSSVFFTKRTKDDIKISDQTIIDQLKGKIMEQLTSDGMFNVNSYIDSKDPDVIHYQIELTVKVPENYGEPKFENIL